MRLQLTVFSLVLIGWLLYRQLASWRRGAPPQAPWWWDVWPTYALLAIVALIAFFGGGKPALLPQWAAWGIVITQLLRGVSLWLKYKKPAVLLGVLCLLLLLYLWAMQLPVFMPRPL